MMDITQAVKPPRAALLDFPPGHTTGAPFDPQLQDAIVGDALAVLEHASESGTIVSLPYRWPGGDGWKKSPLPDRLPRAETPQYQCEADRLAAAAHDLRDCPVCATERPAR